MNTAVQAGGLALLGGLPLAALGWAAAAATERLTRDPRLRERAWALAFHLPLLAAVAASAVALLAPLWPAPQPAAVSVEVSAVLGWAKPGASLARPTLDWSAFAGWTAGAALLGAAVRLAAALAGARRAAGLAMRAQPFTNPPVLKGAANAAARLGVDAPEIRVSPEAGSPLLVGLRRPIVVLPQALAQETETAALTLVCLHELAHLRRGDNRRLLLEAAVLGALWFNPAAYALRAGLRAAREEACDALALEAEPPVVRRLYAETLVRSLRLRAGPELSSAFTGARRRTAMRLTALLHPAPPPRPGRRLAAAGLLGGLAVAAATGALATGLAQDGAASRNSVHSYTSVTTADEPEGATNVAVTVLSDRFEEQGGGRSTATGQVEVRASGAPAGVIEVDGRPQPAGYDPRPLKGRIARVETRNTESGGHPVFNLVTETAAKPQITRPNWIERPSGAELGAAYPAAARAAGVSGRATIRCTVQPAGTLTGCEVVSEAPAGAGFGQATLAIADRFRLQPPTENGRPVPGAVVQVPLLWKVSDEPPAPAASGRADELAGLKPATVPGETPTPSPIKMYAEVFRRNTLGDGMDVYSGDVKLEGRVPEQGPYPIFINGERAPAGLDLKGLGKVSTVEVSRTFVRAGDPERQKVTSMRITTGR